MTGFDPAEDWSIDELLDSESGEQPAPETEPAPEAALAAEAEPAPERKRPSVLARALTNLSRCVSWAPDLLAQSIAVLALGRRAEVVAQAPVAEALTHAGQVTRDVALRLARTGDAIAVNFAQLSAHTIGERELGGRRRRSQTSWIHFDEFVAGLRLRRNPFLAAAAQAQEFSALVRSEQGLRETVGRALAGSETLARSSPGRLAGKMRAALGVVLDARRSWPDNRRLSMRDRHAVSAAAAAAPSPVDVTNAVARLAKVADIALLATVHVEPDERAEVWRQFRIVLRDGPAIAWGAGVAWDAAKHACGDAVTRQPSRVYGHATAAEALDTLDAVWEAWQLIADRGSDAHIGFEADELCTAFRDVFPGLHGAAERLARRA